MQSKVNPQLAQSALVAANQAAQADPSHPGHQKDIKFWSTMCAAVGVTPVRIDEAHPDFQHTGLDGTVLIDD